MSDPATDLHPSALLALLTIFNTSDGRWITLEEIDDFVVAPDAIAFVPDLLRLGLLIHYEPTKSVRVSKNGRSLIDRLYGGPEVVTPFTTFRIVGKTGDVLDVKWSAFHDCDGLVRIMSEPIPRSILAERVDLLRADGVRWHAVPLSVSDVRPGDTVQIRYRPGAFP